MYVQIVVTLYTEPGIRVVVCSSDSLGERLGVREVSRGHETKKYSNIKINPSRSSRHAIHIIIVASTKKIFLFFGFVLFFLKHDSYTTT